MICFSVFRTDYEAVLAGTLVPSFRRESSERRVLSRDPSFRGFSPSQTPGIARTEVTVRILLLRKATVRCGMLAMMSPGRQAVRRVNISYLQSLTLVPTFWVRRQLPGRMTVAAVVYVRRRPLQFFPSDLPQHARGPGVLVSTRVHVAQ